MPTLSEVQKAIQEYQGDIWQVPPMFSAKKKDGVRLYKLARSGVEIAREPVLVNFSSNLVHYSYPYLTIEVECSKGTYIRSIAKSLGEILKCGAHLSELTRTESGSFSLTDSLSADLIESNPNLVMQSLKKGF